MTNVLYAPRCETVIVRENSRQGLSSLRGGVSLKKTLHTPVFVKSLLQRMSSLKNY